MNYRYQYIAGIIFCLIILRLFWQLGTEPVSRWDERNNIRIVNELVHNRTFPYLTYLKSPFFEKPPLWYYLTGLTTTISGGNLISFRIISSFSGVLISYIVWKTCVRWYGEIAGSTSLLVLLTTNQLYIKNVGGFFASHTFRSADPDTLLILFMLMSFLCFGNSAKWSILSGFLFSGLAVLTKGPMGVLPIVVYIIYVLVRKEFSASVLRLWVKGLCLFLLVATPWYIFMFKTFGVSFVAAHFGYNWIARTVTPLEGHNEQWWFYIWLLANKHVFPWLEILVVSILFFVTRREKNSMKYQFLAPIIMVLMIIIIVTLTQTKLAWYILPLYPFAALVTGNAMQQVYNQIIYKRYNNK